MINDGGVLTTLDAGTGKVYIVSQTGGEGMNGARSQLDPMRAHLHAGANGSVEIGASLVSPRA
jgi:hypothetical protein